MQKLPGSIFFISAAVFLAVTKSPDIYTVLAVVACAVIAGFAASRYSQWAAIGGGIIIAISLSLQAILSYRCMDCIMADILILAGVIYLSIMERDRLKKHLWVMSAVMSAVMVLNVGVLYSIFGLYHAEEIEPEKFERFISAITEGREVTLDTSARPVLLFSPNCGACQEVVEELVKLDFVGETWAPVQVNGKPEVGKEYLAKLGYSGSVYQHVWGGVVPALLITEDGQTIEIHGVGEILKTVRGDSG